MREVEVHYKENPWVDMHLYSIQETPLFWKNSLEILWALQGEVTIVLDNEEFLIQEGQLEIVNPMEIRSLKGSKDNRLLVMDIKPSFFAAYYPDAVKTLYYMDDDNKGESEKYVQLKRLISRILYELNQEMDEEEEAVQKQLLDLHYHLLNNFHYLYYEQQELREDPDELQRFHRIAKYLSANYMDKVSLQEIAEKEFLNPSYLSYKIKDTIGLSFHEYLNQIRVEESTKLLLGTDKSISEIAGDVGYSHLRYYLRTFKEHYQMTPQEYRENFALEAMPPMEKLAEEFPLEEAFQDIRSYLSDYNRFVNRLKTEKVRVDLALDPIGEFSMTEMIHLGDATLFLEEENRDLLREVQREIGFQYGIIRDLFSQDLDIYRGRGHRFINWTRVENILDFILGENMEPRIDISRVEKGILMSFVENFSRVYHRDVTEWFIHGLPEGIIPETQSHDYYDMTEFIPKLYRTVLEEKKPCIPSLVDYIDRETELSNDTFFGGGGMFTANGLNKPAFYAWKFLSLLGSEILIQDKGFLLTRDLRGYQILLYSYEKDDRAVERKVIMNLLNMDADFHITRFSLDAKNGSIYDKWKELGEPERVDTMHWTLLDEYVHPKMEFYYGEKSMVFPILTKVEENGAVLFLLNDVLS